MKKKKSKASLAPKLPDRERWYQLVAMFDDQDLRATPIKGAFFRGALDKLTIVEVQKDFPDEQYGPLASWLENNGIEAIVVKEGVRFLRIKPATKAEAEVLDKHMAEQAAEPKEKESAAAVGH